ncbi:MAG: GspH/FimT family pseudopilin [Gammaproteobacteria bacterium]|nr:GspH/FimT family pseudopilin [Gammaproteobacteria bacterium]MCZ6762736.1 GspH/FimT family pseudopilin [Gammaproteobacteria bacterium]MCZ6880968.1 GspH/FimT family pseudopilin [Gammaproteobacteria bacterium]
MSCALRADSTKISGMKNRSSCYGMTLIELLLVVSVVAILLANGIPSFREMIMDNRRTAAINELVGTIQFARGEAAKRNREVVLCPSGGGSQCTADPWNLGWLVFANLDQDSPARLDEDEPLLYVKAAREGLKITANRRVFRFRPLGVRSVNGTVTFCDSRGAQSARAVIISHTGRPRVSGRSAGNRRLQCP